MFDTNLKLTHAVYNGSQIAAIEDNAEAGHVALGVNGVWRIYRRDSEDGAAILAYAGLVNDRQRAMIHYRALHRLAAAEASAANGMNLDEVN